MFAFDQHHESVPIVLLVNLLDTASCRLERTKNRVKASAENTTVLMDLTFEWKKLHTDYEYMFKNPSFIDGNTSTQDFYELESRRAS